MAEDDEDSAVQPLLSSGKGYGSAGITIPSTHDEHTSFRQTLVLAFGLCICATAVNTAMFQATSHRGNAGANSLGILYSSFTLTTLVCSTLVRKIGPKHSLVLGATAYTAFLTANIWFVPWMLYLGGAIQGAGSALLWTAHGVYLSRLAQFHEIKMDLPPHSTLGYFNGVFFSIFMMSLLFGNLIVALLYFYDVNTQLIFSLAVLTCLVGVLDLTYLRPMPHPHDTARSDDQPLWQTVKVQYHKMAAIAGDTKMRYLMPIFVYYGLSKVFIMGEFPPLIHHMDMKFAVMASFGFSDVVFSIVLGLGSDRLGRRPVILLGFLTHAAVYVWLLLQHLLQREKEIFVLMALLWGCGDACFNTQVYALVTSFFENQSEPAFAVFKFVQSVSMATMFFATKHLLPAHQYCVLIISLVLGTLFVMLMDRWVASIEFSPNAHRKRVVDADEP